MTLSLIVVVSGTSDILLASQIASATGITLEIEYESCFPLLKLECAHLNTWIFLGLGGGLVYYRPVSCHVKADRGGQGCLMWIDLFSAVSFSS